MDVMWLVLPRGDDERAIDMTGFRIGRGQLVVVLARAEQWQLAYVILKGDSHAIRKGGLGRLPIRGRCARPRVGRPGGHDL